MRSTSSLRFYPYVVASTAVVATLSFLGSWPQDEVRARRFVLTDSKDRRLLIISEKDGRARISFLDEKGKERAGIVHTEVGLAIVDGKNRTRVLMALTGAVQGLVLADGDSRALARLVALEKGREFSLFDESGQPRFLVTSESKTGTTDLIVRGPRDRVVALSSREKVAGLVVQQNGKKRVAVLAADEFANVSVHDVKSGAMSSLLARPDFVGIGVHPEGRYDRGAGVRYAPDPGRASAWGSLDGTDLGFSLDLMKDEGVAQMTVRSGAGTAALYANRTSGGVRVIDSKDRRRIEIGADQKGAVVRLGNEEGDAGAVLEAMEDSARLGILRGRTSFTASCWKDAFRTRGFDGRGEERFRLEIRKDAVNGFVKDAEGRPLVELREPR